MALSVTGNLRSSSGTNKGVYSVKCLVGNWSEARYDPQYRDGRAVLPSDQDFHWNSEFVETIGNPTLKPVDPNSTISKALVELENTANISEMQDQFQDPNERVTIMRTFMGGRHLPAECKIYDNRPFEERTAEYREQWTRSNIKMREKMVSECGKQFVRPKKHLTAFPVSFGIPIVDRIQERLWKWGGKYSVRSLRKALNEKDERGSGMLTPEQFKQALASVGVHFTNEDMRDAMEYFDSNAVGVVATEDVLRALRRPLSERRISLIQQAYTLITKQGTEKVTRQKLLQLYDTSKHPDVLNRGKSRKQLLEEFSRGWYGHTEEGSEVSLAEFTEYYSDISATVGDDDYFELLLRNAWHLSGGSRPACTNATCRRVLVVHANGAQTIEEVKDDLHIAPEDLSAMEANLNAQGITDVKRIVLKDNQ